VDIFNEETSESELNIGDVLESFICAMYTDIQGKPYREHLEFTRYITLRLLEEIQNSHQDVTQEHFDQLKIRYYIENALLTLID